ncbi:hypothetical protein [Cytobacillus kochii]|nr:hypothetical protein [Cytobacillus kochii]MCA1024515.1 hypothetical protein [Cytobacillus kochii]MCM3323498.1 hypothetical protein [Cytobacillus kochii]MCM3345893.1 hypothetical protein [Cytobacillus kochii]
MMKIMFLLAAFSVGLFAFLDKHFWGLMLGLAFFFIGLFFIKPRFKKNDE